MSTRTDESEELESNDYIDKESYIRELIIKFRRDATIEPISYPRDKNDVVLEEPSQLSPFYKVYQIYKKHEAVFWTSNEIDMSIDKQHYDMLNKDEQRFLSHILGFFAGSDVLVNNNIESNYIPKITEPYITVFYDYQKMAENTHSFTYSNMLRALLSVQDYDRVKNAVITMPIVKKKADWARKWIHADCTLSELLVAFKCVEGIFFAGSFCAIYWLAELRKNNKEGLFPGIRYANEFIARDEGIHTLFADTVYKEHIVNKLPYELVREIFLDAVRIEKEFIISALPCKLIGMNSQLMSQYIEYVANHEIKSLGYVDIDQLLFPPRPCPFQFMLKISLQKKNNFFELQGAEYSKSGSHNICLEDGIFGLDEDF